MTTTEPTLADPVDYERHGSRPLAQPDPSGSFRRPASAFVNRIRAGTEYSPDPGRYHIYAAYNCPWAHRTAIVRKLMGLDEVVTISYLDDERDGRGWAFRTRHGADPVNGFSFLSEAYLATDPDYDGLFTTPALWDRLTGTIVNNSNVQICEDLATQFAGLASDEHDLYPAGRGDALEELRVELYRDVNNNVYKAGTEIDQERHEERAHRFFAALDALDERLGSQPFLFGDRLTIADVWLWPTLIRFDLVYHTLFKLNLRRLSDYEHLWPYARRLYAMSAFRETTNVESIKRGYFTAFENANPSRVIPIGPDTDWTDGSD